MELAANARVTGNVYYCLLEMAMGAEVNGNLLRTDEEPDRLLLSHSSAGSPSTQTPQTSHTAHGKTFEMAEEV